jgi:hypothetical protein
MNRFMIASLAVAEMMAMGTVSNAVAAPGHAAGGALRLAIVQSDGDDSLDAQENAREAAEDSAEAAEKARQAPQEAAREALEVAEEARGEAQEACEGSGHCGGAGVLTTQLIWFDKNPLRTLAHKDRDLRLRDFDFPREPTVMLGIMGHHESRSGFRGGMSLWAGYNSFESAEYPVDRDTATHDSITTLRFVPVYGGFNFDKVFHFGRMSLSMGGMLGGGAYLLFMREYDLDESAAFVTVDSDTANEKSVRVGFAWAPLMTAEARVGTMVDLAPVFHIGLDGVLLMNYSPEGFDVATGNFFSVNPGVRLRLVFGKA